MTVYCIRSDGAPRYYGSKREAFSEAREATRDISRDAIVEVERVELVKFDKETILRVINQEGGYASSVVVVAVFKGGRKI